MEHPTVLEIAQRQQEIDEWCSARARWGRWFRLYGVGPLLVALLAAGLLVAMGPWVWPGLLLFGAAFVGVVVRCNYPYIPPDCPQPLQVVPFTANENAYHRYLQWEPEPFRAWCGCPGCGDVDVHLLERAGGDPAWANVIRRCRRCDRQWGQA